jgi:hypothetical protein
MNYSCWNQFWKNKTLRNEFLFTFILLLVLLYLFSNYLNYIESRQGIVLNDPVIKSFKPIDVTWFTFLLIYIGVVAAIISLSQFPERLTFAIQVYIVMVLFRIIAMYIVPLEPPASMIQLKDPVVEHIGTGIQINKDLFFSGHTATMFLLYLVSANKLLKNIYLVLTFLIAICVLIQHVHYTIDILSAPFFTFGSYSLVIFIKRFFNKNILLV